MARSLNLETEVEKFYRIYEFLINNNKVIQSDLKKEFKERLNKGRSNLNGFKLLAFEKHIEESMRQRIKELMQYTATDLYIYDCRDISNEIDDIIKGAMSPKGES